MRLLLILALLAAVIFGANALHNHWPLEIFQGQSESEFASRYSKSLLIVDGDVGKGSASIIMLKGNPLLVTNMHVVSGNTNTRFRLLNSQEITPDTIGVPEDRDILVASQHQIKEGLVASTAVDTEVAIGDAVVVLGNSQGSDVVTEIKGKVLGIGPDLVETDAKFVPGNSGSPIIHVKSGKVIAIATFATIRKLDSLSRDSQFSEVRRFGYRLDTISKWKFLTPEAFSVESGQVTQVKQRTDDLLSLAKEILKTGTITPMRYDPNRWVGQSLRHFNNAAFRPLGSALDSRQPAEPLLRSLPEFCGQLNCDVNALRIPSLLPYHRKELESEVQTRTLLTDFFSRIDWSDVEVRR